jgi:hypothetical protein
MEQAGFEYWKLELLTHRYTRYGERYQRCKRQDHTILKASDMTNSVATGSLRMLPRYTWIAPSPSVYARKSFFCRDSIAQGPQ